MKINKYLRPEAPAAFDLGKEGGPEESMSSTGNKMEIQSTRQYPHLGLQAPQPTSELGPGLTKEFPIYKRDMEIRRRLVTPAYPPPVHAESRRASVERGSKSFLLLYYSLISYYLL